MGQEFVVPSFNTNRYYNKNTENIAVLPTGLTAGMVIYVQSDGTLDGSLNHFWDDTNNILIIGDITKATTIALGGSVQVITPSITSTAEVLQSWKVADDTVSNFRIANSTAGGAAFGAGLIGTSAGSTSPGLLVQSEITTDTGSSNSFVFSTRTAASGVVESRPLFTFRNNTTEVFEIDAKGRQYVTTRAAVSGSTAAWVLLPGADTGITNSTESNVFRIDTQTRTWNTTGTVAAQYDVKLIGMTYASGSASQTFTIGSTLFVSSPTAGANAIITSAYAAHFQANAITGAAEDIARFDVSDASGFIAFENGTGTNAVFSGTLRMANSTTGLAAQYVGQGATDSGSTEVTRFVSRIGTATGVATRRAFDWNNAGTTIMSIQGTTASSKLLVGDFAATPVGYSPVTTRNIEVIRSAASGGYVGSSWSNSGTHATIFEGLKSRSATVGTMTIVQSGDPTLFLLGRGSDGTAFTDNARIGFFIDGTPGTNDMPGRIEFATTPDGSTTLTEALRISSRRNTLVNLGAIAEPSTSIGTLVLTNTATAPTTSVDAVSLFSADVAGAGSASLAVFTEQAVAIDAALVSTHSLKVNINGTVYRIPLTTP